MSKVIRLFKIVVVCTVLSLNLAAQTDRARQVKTFAGTNNLLKMEHSEKHQTLLDSAVRKTIDALSLKGVKAENVAATLIDLRDATTPKTASFRGNEKIYPASVVKMFYMAALHRQLEDGKLRMSPELERGLKDMITVSSNDATGYILDVLTGTSSGAERNPKEFKQWGEKRNSINRYFRSLGYANINVNQKTFCEDAYGVEQQFRGENGENRNMLTTDATARLLAEIATGKSVTIERSKQMMYLMERDWEKPTNNPDEKEFVSDALKPGMKLWSKEGWTSKTRHDAAYIETPDGLKFVLVVYTENFATERDIIPGIAEKVIKGLGEFK